MEEIDFKKYKYFYNGWIARKDKTTNKTELFYKGTWTPWVFGHDLEWYVNFEDDMVELSDNDRDKKLLRESIRQKIKERRTI